MKGKISLFTQQTYKGGGDVQFHSFLTLEQDGGGWSASLPSFFTLSERATHWVGGKGVPRTGLDVVEERKIFYPCPEIRFLALKKIQ